MIIANAGGSYVQFMTRGNGRYNPTGLLRVHLRDGHPQLGYSDGIWRQTPETAGPVEVLEETARRVRFKVGQETLTLDADGVTVVAESVARIGFPMLVNDGQEETTVKLDGNVLRLKLAGREMQVVITEPATAAWQRTNKRLSHRNGLVEEAFADGIAYRICVIPMALRIHTLAR
jgi:hypothetical protein